MIRTQHIGATWRSGAYRATYRPDWDAASPWILAIGGTIMAFHAATERGALSELERRGAVACDWRLSP